MGLSRRPHPYTSRACWYLSDPARVVQIHELVVLMPAILIVDDDTDLRDALAEVFAVAGYSVTTAANGKEALACLDEHRPNVILLDMMMPVMGGREFLEGKRARPAVADVPVIVASASTSDEVPGATAMFDKPCDVEELLGTVAGIVRRASARRATGDPRPSTEHARERTAGRP